MPSRCQTGAPVIQLEDEVPQIIAPSKHNLKQEVNEVEWHEQEALNSDGAPGGQELVSQSSH